MKKIIFVMTLAANLFGAELQLLISKSSGGGLMMPEYAGYEKCDVYNDKVIIERGYGATATGLRLSEKRAIKIDGDVALVVKNAQTETVTSKPNNLCDGPSTQVSTTDQAGKTVVLFSTGGCGSPRLSRDGVYSEKLRNIVDVFCPKTYDFSDPQ